MDVNNHNIWTIGSSIMPLADADSNNEGWIGYALFV